MMNFHYKPFISLCIIVAGMACNASTALAASDHFPPTELKCTKDATGFQCIGHDKAYLQIATHSITCGTGTYPFVQGFAFEPNDKDGTVIYEYQTPGCRINLATTYPGIFANINNKNWVMVVTPPNAQYNCIAGANNCPFTNVPYYKKFTGN